MEIARTPEMMNGPDDYGPLRPDQFEEFYYQAYMLDDSRTDPARFRELLARFGYKSNEQFVKDIMAFSRRGPLAQIFVVEAIRKYAEACAEADPAVFDSPLMNGAAWVDVAKEIRDKMNEWKAS